MQFTAVLPEVSSADVETLSIMIPTGGCAGTRLTASVRVSSANEGHNPCSRSFVKQGQQKSFNEKYEKASFGEITLFLFGFTNKCFVHSCCYKIDC